MSFSGEVKKELAAVEIRSRHCQLAELAAILSGSGCIKGHGGQLHILLVTENEQVAKRYVQLLQQAGDITAAVKQVP